MSLAVTRDHCRRMAETEPHEPLWAAIADEIDAYLARHPDDGDNAAPDQEEVLWT